MQTLPTLYYQAMQGRIQDFFQEGVHSFFAPLQLLLCRKPAVLGNRRGGGGGPPTRTPCALPLDPPLLCYLYLMAFWPVRKQYRTEGFCSHIRTVISVQFLQRSESISNKKGEAQVFTPYRTAFRFGTKSDEKLFGIVSGAPNDCFLYNICSEKQILPRIFFFLRTAINFQMNVPFMYNFRSLCNKFPTIF